MPDVKRVKCSGCEREDPIDTSPMYSVAEVQSDILMVYRGYIPGLDHRCSADCLAKLVSRWTEKNDKTAALAQTLMVASTDHVETAKHKRGNGESK